MNGTSIRTLWVVGFLGLIWNIYGVYQFIGSVMATEDSLITMGMTMEQAALMTSYPFWMTLAFGIGVFGGLIGSILLLLKKALAQSVFLASLTGYVILYIGDITEGVFAALGTPQIVILTSVVLIAFGLWWFARSSQRGGVLT